MKEVYRINYANEMHHRQNLRNQIDPKVIQRIEIDQNPSLNYRNAFKSVYYDELERTIQYQQQKKLKEKEPLTLSTLSTNVINRNSSQPSLHLPSHPFANIGNRSRVDLQIPKLNEFIDYDIERNKRFDQYIEGGYDGGKSFFRSQQQYQRKKQEDGQLARSTLLHQLQLKENKKMHDMMDNRYEADQMRENRKRQLECEVSELNRKKMQERLVGQEVRQQAEVQRANKCRKSHFQFNNIARHNPITNPIEYHIDNPYILQKYTSKVNHSEPNQEITLGNRGSRYQTICNDYQ